MSQVIWLHLPLCKVDINSYICSLDCDVVVTFPKEDWWNISGYKDWLQNSDNIMMYRYDEDSHGHDHVLKSVLKCAAKKV